MKHYINSLADLVELKYTDVKIYEEGISENFYYRFIDDTLCYFKDDILSMYNTGLIMNGDTLYTKDEEDEIEITIDHNDFGKLCVFWNCNNDGNKDEIIGVLTNILVDENVNDNTLKNQYVCNDFSHHLYCRRATKEDIEHLL